MKHLIVILAIAPWLSSYGQTNILDTRQYKVSVEDSGLLKGLIVEGDFRAYYIQHFRWGRWITLDTIKTQGKDTVYFEFQLPAHSGENKYRIDFPYTGGRKCGVICSFKQYFDVGETELYNKKTRSDTIYFSNKTDYEIYDSTGKLISRGYSDKITNLNLDRGIYYISYDNKMDMYKRQ